MMKKMLPQEIKQMYLENFLPGKVIAAQACGPHSKTPDLREKLKWLYTSAKLTFPLARQEVDMGLQGWFM